MGKYAHVPNLQEIVTASLLHDIGKFYQRASESDSLDNYYKENYCVDRGSYSSYLHAGFTAKFFDEQKGIFSCFENYEAIRDISATHHRPNTIFQKIISAADRASAGFDRVVSETSQDYKRFREVPLRSLFSMIKFSDKNDVTKKAYRLNYLLDDNVFPKDMDFLNNEQVSKKLAGLENYKNLYKEFIKEFSNINKYYYPFFEAYLIRMLEKYLWAIPSATNDETNDISLYDHSYTTASIASTLFLFLKNEYDGNWESCDNLDILNDKSEMEKVKFARILKVDVSGIQNYIYDIKKAVYSSKLLRARSFNVTFLLKGIAQKIKDGLGLDQVNILFEGGGNLQMMIPNNHFFIDKLNKIQQEIEEFVFENYQGELNFIFTVSDPISLSDFNLTNFNKNVRSNLEQKLEISKLKKLQGILNKKGHIIHESYEKLAKKSEEGFSICPTCEKWPSNKSNNENLCDFCNKLVNVGREITETECFVITKKPTGFNLLPGLFLDFRKNNSISNYIQNKEQENILQVFGTKKASFGLRFSNPYYVPDENGETITFEDFGESAIGTKKIAMLKGDVNDLGAIFWFGIKRKYRENKDNKEENIINISFKKDRIIDLIQNGKYHGQIFETYLIFENKNCLLIVDQHAADERISYNILIENINKKRRILLFPKVIDLLKIDEEEIEKIIDLFDNAGIEMTRIGKNKIQIFAIPQIVPSIDEDNFINETIDFIANEFKSIRIELKDFIKLFYSHIIAKSACHLAIKQGDILTEFEAKNLCKKLFDQDSFEKCPHGRPTFFLIDKDNFEKIFLRKK
ncbi:MAG: type III-A CRISPR-associated protein Cas10/Csm1 [Spirochaetota bacterium]